ncbi:DUF6542 domain-containing protein [Nocardiopsis lambiniae]|uniref:DUF6542 domain-containing protein n=1 Tax=Nocardiopsis lambiniae TaxID=3075539 RepID=A0ABU2M6R5_9ACTN|nr:DUF6542 domain-containing protein [Nocardiopsis sp. DSM 44743]MDT0327911.1 hypothetical protein [Nocardiopsis sp. DSM 44743]
MPTRKTEGPEPGRAPYFVRPDRHGRTAQKNRKPGPARPTGTLSKSGPRPAAPRARQNGPRLTGRGGVLVIALFSVTGTVLAHVAELPTAPGVAFTLACLLTVSLVRTGDLLSLSVSPPIAFFAAVVAAESVLALGNEGFARVLLLALASRLAQVAPWLFLGTALVLVIGVFRGLPGNVRELGDQVNGRR